MLVIQELSEVGLSFFERLESHSMSLAFIELSQVVDFGGYLKNANPIVHIVNPLPLVLKTGFLLQITDAGFCLRFRGFYCSEVGRVVGVTNQA